MKASVFVVVVNNWNIYTVQNITFLCYFVFVVRNVLSKTFSYCFINIPHICHLIFFLSTYWIIHTLISVKICLTPQKNLLKCTHLQAIQDVDEFVLLDLEKVSITVHHLLTNGSSAVNGCRQNKSTNPQVIHMTPVHQLTPNEIKSCL